MSTEGFLTDDEINALVQTEAGNHAYFQLTEEQIQSIRVKIESSDMNQIRYLKSKQSYEEIHDVVIKKSSSFTVWKIAAVVSLLIVAGLTLSNFWFNRDHVNAITNSFPEVTEEDLLSENFQLNEEFENYVNYPMRGAGFELKKPATGMILDRQVIFEWILGNGNDFVLKIYSNKQRVLFEKQVSEPSFSLDEKLSSGLYYWSLENEDEIVHWGKFYFKK